MCNSKKYSTALYKFNALLNLCILVFALTPSIVSSTPVYRRSIRRCCPVLPVIKQALSLTFLIYIAPLLVVDGDGRPPPILMKPRGWTSNERFGLPPTFHSLILMWFWCDFAWSSLPHSLWIKLFIFFINYFVLVSDVVWYHRTKSCLHRCFHLCREAWVLDAVVEPKKASNYSLSITPSKQSI